MLTNIGDKAVISERIREAMNYRKMSQADLCRETGLSKATMNFYVHGKTPPKQKNMFLLAKALRVRIEWLMGIDGQMTHSPTVETIQIHDLLSVPMLGKVAAGSPIYADGNIEGEVMIDPQVAAGCPCFALKVKGDSMTPQILDRDIIIVREQEEVDDGDIVVATVNGGEGCVKRLKKYANAISLVSMNPDYEPMYFTAEAIDTMPVRIWGKVVEIRRAI